VTATANIVLDQSVGQIRIGPSTGTYLIIDGGNAQVRSSNYASGTFGSGFLLSGSLLEVGNARIRGTLTSVVFEKTQVASVGGTILVSTGSDVLASAMTALDASTMTTNGKETFAVGDFLRINIAGVEEWFEVTAADSAPTYTVTRDKASAFSANANPTWTAGTVVINYGVSGAGGISISASGTPKFDIFTHAGAPWSATTTQLRIGNLNGFLGYTTNDYGIAIGTATAYLKYDPTNGLRLKSTASQDGVVNAPVNPNMALKAKNDAYWQVAKDGMWRVINGTEGTGRRAFANTPYKAAGKSGTAQVVGMKENQVYDASTMKVEHRDNALFVAFAPVQDPRIAVAVIVENGGHGGSVAAPVARKVIDAYLGQAPAEIDAAEAEDGD
jgi:hypothetical protein